MVSVRSGRDERDEEGRMGGSGMKD